MTGILIVGSLTLLASFLCSLFEAALYAVTPAQLEILRARGDKGGVLLARLRKNVEEPIAAILTVNTIAHTVGAAWCGAMAAEAFGSQAVGVFAAVFTFLVLVVTEIIPKSLGVRYANEIGPRIAFPIQLMIWIAWPIARPSRAAMKLFGGKHRTLGPSEEEVLALTGLAARHGRVSTDEHDLVRNALALDAVTVGELRTPRTVVETLPASTLVSACTTPGSAVQHSRVPLVDGADPENVIGLVHRRAIYDAVVAGESDRELRELMCPIGFVPESAPADTLLRTFLAQRTHMAAVVDEYGGFDGVITLEDILERLLGAQIVDEHDEVEDLQEHARKLGEQRLGG